jgi:hypothetical protein
MTPMPDRDAATRDPVDRPLAVVMVADPTPLTLANLRRLSTWCDLLLTEGTSTTSGTPREPLRAGWRELLGLQPPELRVMTTDLGGTTSWRRQATQRNSAMAVIFQEPDDRWVLMVDADEFLDPAAVADAITSISAAATDTGSGDGDEPVHPDPVRLGLVPLYGAVDRAARQIHCCWKADWPDLRASAPRQPYLFAGASLATAGAMKRQAPTRTRFASRLIGRDRTYGVHVTMAEPADQVAWKLTNMRHVWQPRILEPQHLETMLSAGVHHAGWWVAEEHHPEPWLVDLAAEANLRVAGPPAPDEHLRALRAWAEVRLDPLVPDALVQAGDDYVATRPHDARDFLIGLDEWLLTRPVAHSGHVGTGGPSAHGDEAEPEPAPD